VNRNTRSCSIGVLIGITCLMILISSGVSQASPIINCPSHTYYLKGVAPDLDLNTTFPTATTPTSIDSASLTRSGGNVYKVIGTWDSYTSIGGGCVLSSLSDLHVWLGLRNSDDQGTQFDLKAEVFAGANPVPLATGEALCIIGVTRNPAKALETTVHFGPVTQTVFDGATELFLRLSTRIGTGVSCPGHANATGLRLYYDAVTRASEFDTSFTQCETFTSRAGEENLLIPCPCDFTSRAGEQNAIVPCTTSNLY